jgi:PKD repeat protein
MASDLRRAGIIVVLLVVLTLPVTAAQTTTLEVVRYGWDNVTVAESRTVNVSWMEANLQVHGDGVTPYLFQGPTFNPSDLWNPAENINLEYAKVNETLRGTAIRDLVDLVGGMHPGDEVQVRSTDGFRKRLAYGNIYTPQARQGTAVVAWWNAKNGYAWPESMRLFFLADTSTNPNGWHIFGNEDMRQCIAEKDWHFFEVSPLFYPSAAGLSVTTVTRLEIYPAPRAVTVAGGSDTPTDMDGDGLYEDVNGNGRKDFADVVLYFNQMTWIGANEPVRLFDYNGNGRIDFADVVWLFAAL